MAATKRPLTAEQLREGAKRYRREHPDVPTVREVDEHPERHPEAAARLNAFARRFEAAKTRRRAQLRELPAEERRRVERMDCRTGDAYLAARLAQPRASGAKPVRHQGSRRYRTGTSTSRGDPPGNSDDDPPGVSHPPARRDTAGVAR